MIWDLGDEWCENHTSLISVAYHFHRRCDFGGLKQLHQLTLQGDEPNNPTWLEHVLLVSNTRWDGGFVCCLSSEYRDSILSPDFYESLVWLRKKMKVTRNNRQVWSNHNDYSLFLLYVVLCRLMFRYSRDKSWVKTPGFARRCWIVCPVGTA